MNDGTPKRPDQKPVDDLVDEQEFESLLREMEETFGIDQDTGGDDEDTEDLEVTGELTRPSDDLDERDSQDEPSTGFHVESGIVETLDDAVLDFAVQTMDGGPAQRAEETPPAKPPTPPDPEPPPAEPEQPPAEPVKVAPGTTLSVRFSVHAATGGGQFRDTKAKGQLGGQQSYPFSLLDDFSFGFDEKRNEYEIILDPTAAEAQIKEIEPAGDFTILCDEWGEIWLLKPTGVRVDLYRIARLETGERKMEQVRTVEQHEMEPVWLPTEAAVRFDQYTEFMLGIGLTEEENLCYAFSVYVAVGLAPPV